MIISTVAMRAWVNGKISNSMFKIRIIWYIIVLLAIIHFLDTLSGFIEKGELEYVVIILPFYIISNVVLFFLYPHINREN